MRQSELLKKYAQLTERQKERVIRELEDLIALNEELKDSKPKECPHCRKDTKMIKKGKQSGKQRYQCQECGRYITYDSHTITSHLQITEEEFFEICKDTVNLVPIKETSARLNRSIQTIFNNRHKFLVLLENMIQSEHILLSGTIEIDETYELESSKGVTPTNRKARKRGEPSKYRGISHEQACIITSTDRQGHEIFKAVGFSKPTSQIITDNFAKSIINNSVLYVDGAFCYDQLAIETNCKLVNLKTFHAYNQVEHLNTVNNIHRFIKETFAFYRGIATKYMNRYMSLFTMIRRCIDMDYNEKIELLIKAIKSFHCSITIRSLKTANLFASY